MNIGSLAKKLMKDTISFAGDGAVAVSITLVSNVVYNPADGSYSSTQTTTPIGDALKSQVSTSEMAKYKLQTSSHKILVSMKDYEASGAADPETWDKLLIGAATWQIEKVVTGPFDEALCFFICKPSG